MARHRHQRRPVAALDVPGQTLANQRQQQQQQKRTETFGEKNIKDRASLDDDAQLQGRVSLAISFSLVRIRLFRSRSVDVRND